MTVRYTGTGGIHPLYECIGRWEHGNKAACSSVPAGALDQEVSEKILAIMKPSELETSLKVMHSINDADRMSDKQWLLSVERAQYEADRAEQQFSLQTRKTAWLSAHWNPTGTRSSRNRKKQNRITPYTIPQKPGSLPQKKNRTSWPPHKRSRKSGMRQLLRNHLIKQRILKIQQFQYNGNKNCQHFTLLTGRMYTDRQIVLYEYQLTRNASHPREFLKDFSDIFSKISGTDSPRSILPISCQSTGASSG